MLIHDNHNSSKLDTLNPWIHSKLWQLSSTNLLIVFYFFPTLLLSRQSHKHLQTRMKMSVIKHAKFSPLELSHQDSLKCVNTPWMYLDRRQNVADRRPSLLRFIIPRLSRAGKYIRPPEPRPSHASLIRRYLLSRRALSLRRAENRAPRW